MDDEERKDRLRKRGEGEILTSDGGEYFVQVVQSKCMGAESCVQVASEVFSLDANALGIFGTGNPLRMKNVPAGALHSESLITAAKSCPYHAIYVLDKRTGGVEAGEPDDRG